MALFNSCSQKREFVLVSSLNHPNVITYRELDCQTNPDKVYLFMELCDGPVLTYMPPRELGNQRRCYVKEVVRQLLTGLVYLASQCVAHHDVKPDNVLIRRDQTQPDCFLVKLCDFGIAERFDPAMGCTNFFGSPAYQAPEIVRNSDGHPFDGAKADVWAAGVSLYQLACDGKLPFNGNSVYLIMKAIETEPLSIPPFPKPAKCDSSFLSRDNRLLTDLLLSMLIKDPITRPSAAQALEHPWFSFHPSTKSAHVEANERGYSCCTVA